MIFFDAVLAFLGKRPLPPPPESIITKLEHFLSELSEASLVSMGFGAAFLIWLWLYRLRPRPIISPFTDLGARVVLITGCDSGFGRGLVEACVEQGFEVVAACYTTNGANQYDDIKNAYAVVADLTDDGGISKIVTFTKTKIGVRGLFALVNNAGVAFPGNVEWAKPPTFEATMKLNFFAPVKLVYELLPSIKRAKGRVVNVTSVDGFINLPTNAAYCSSKHALESYSDVLRCEMKPWGVDVVVVQPATMRTPMAMAFADSWGKSFKTADSDRRAAYGDLWAEKVTQAMKKVSSEAYDCTSLDTLARKASSPMAQL
jgi:NAD(P)-dependent dehydrogenase (short-subunit alcohol dehydrogenase family)